MIKLLLLALILISGCREFYDEEFEEGQFQPARENVTYSATLSSTDPNLTSINGNSTVQVQNGNVNVSLELSGIPENIIQIHYGYLATGCNNLNLAIPLDTSGSTRTYSVNETSTIDGLQTDLSSSGAANFSGDTNLENKSFVVKAFSSFSGLPNATGTNSLIIACGNLEVTSTDDGSISGPVDIDGTQTDIGPQEDDVLTTPDDPLPGALPDTRDL